MLGAIIGDIAGSRFEWHPIKRKDFKLLSHIEGCRPTDDSVMTLAIAKAILDCEGNFTNLAQMAVKRMQEMGRFYSGAGYGGRFETWIWAKDPQPYFSFGNGAAMRVSPCAYAARSMEEAIELSRKVTAVTHNHPEGLKGAEAVTAAIYMALHGKRIPEIREYMNAHYYSMQFTLEDIRDDYHFDVTCQGSVPQAIMAFLESTDYEDAVRNAISLGGDSDTQAAIAGSIAEGYYGISEEIRRRGLGFLDEEMAEIVNQFEAKYKGR